MRKIIGISFIFIQIVMIGYARFIPQRYFCWAPHDSQAEYILKVTINGEELSDDQVKARYHINKRGRDPRAIQHVKDIIRQYEETYGSGDRSHIIMHYRVNGITKEPWVWPQK